MPVLENPKEEKFCQLRADGGLTINASYVGAGYKSHRGNASRLSSRENIRERVAEIQGHTAKTISDIKEMAREYTQGVLENLWKIHNDKKAPTAARVMAGAILLDRGHGKAAQTIEVELTVYDKLPLPERQALLGVIDVLVDDAEGASGGSSPTQH